MELLIPLAPFIMVVAIVAIVFVSKNRDRREIQQTIRTALERGQPLPAEMVEAMSQDTRKPVPSAARDMRIGVIWLAVALGLTVMGWSLGFVDGDNEIFYVMSGIASIPGFIGLAFIVLSFFNKNKD
ncbi:MAG: hypothetical protein ACI8U3_002066 [Brevundimonas sp.]|jgi:hypothetical protein